MRNKSMVAERLFCGSARAERTFLAHGLCRSARRASRCRRRPQPHCRQSSRRDGAPAIAMLGQAYVRVVVMNAIPIGQVERHG